MSRTISCSPTQPLGETRPCRHPVSELCSVFFGARHYAGPNIAYLVSRSISQGRRAGFISLIGIAAAFVIYRLCAVFGLTAIILNVPLAYDVLRFGGACYLLYLAWQVLRCAWRSRGSGEYIHLSESLSAKLPFPPEHRYLPSRPWPRPPKT